MFLEELSSWPKRYVRGLKIQTVVQKMEPKRKLLRRNGFKPLQNFRCVTCTDVHYGGKAGEWWETQTARGLGTYQAPIGRAAARRRQTRRYVAGVSVLARQPTCHRVWSLLLQSATWDFPVNLSQVLPWDILPFAGTLTQHLLRKQFLFSRNSLFTQ